MHEDVKRYCNTCFSCQRYKASSQKKEGLLNPLPVTGQQWHRISLDFVTALPTTPRGMDSVCVFVDAATKMVHIAPCSKTLTARECAQLFITNVFKLHGLPREIISDRDKLFISKFWKELMKQLGINHKMSSPYHPQTDGQTEVMNKTFQNMLRHYVADCQTDWDLQCPIIEFAMNNSYHFGAQDTPFMLNFARPPITPTDLITGQTHVLQQEGHFAETCPAASELKRHLQHRLTQAVKCLNAAKQHMTAQANKHRRSVAYNVGDMVLLSTQHMNMDRCDLVPKFRPKYIGPFPVEKVLTQAVKVKLPPHMAIHNVFHVSMCRKYRSDGRYQPPPPVTIVDNLPEYEVESILAHRQRTRSSPLEYLIKWKNYPPEYNTWEPSDNAKHAPIAINAYWHKVKHAGAEHHDAKRRKVS